MGGNALKELGVERIPKELFEQYVNEILTILDHHDFYKKVFIPPYVSDKETFGDLDILLVKKTNFAVNANNRQFVIYQDTIGFIKEVFNPKKVITNGNVFSWDYKNFQIDFIMCNEEDFDIYKNFIHWGDSSMVMGRIARLFDLKYGIYGLEFILRDPETNHVVNEINISKNPRKCMEFIGYDYDRWEKGFNTEEELRDFVFSSKYISQEFLTAYSENTKHRKRDKNRGQYQRFHDWFMDNKDKFPLESQVTSDKEKLLDIISDYFPESNVRTHVNTFNYTMSRRRQARAKFNGDHIRKVAEKVINLDDKTFGGFMRMWNEKFPDENTRINYIIFNDIEELEKDVTDFALCEFMTHKK